MNPQNYVVGREGEQIAAHFLEKKGYIIREINYTTKFGEIDIVAMDKDILVVCEVKRRKFDTHGRPGEAVNYYKQRQIARVTQSFIAKHRLYHHQVRFDVIEILGDTIEHIENAFFV